MSAEANGITTPTMSAMLAKHGSDSSAESLAGRRQFKKHKVLPHPAKRRQDAKAPQGPRPMPKRCDLALDTAPTQRHASQPTIPSSTLQQPHSKRVRSGPVMPPTPPAHSRASSSSHSVQPSSPTYIETPSHSLEAVEIHVDRPSTPPNQDSPPTPDVTPPQPLGRPKALRLVAGERSVSKTASESRTESFRTAREEPWTSEEDDSKQSARSALPSTRTSETTVRPVSNDKPKQPQTLGLGIGFGRTVPDDLTPKTKGEFFKFDGAWESSCEIEPERNYKVESNIVVKKRRKASETPVDNRYAPVLEDKIVAPTNATKALRSMSLQDKSPSTPPAKNNLSRGNSQATPSSSDPSISPDRRRHSGMSSRSNVSTVVEAMLVGRSSMPQRRQTLRHVRKNGALRNSAPSPSEEGPAPGSSDRVEEGAKLLRPPIRSRENNHGRHGSYTSTTACNSISSRRTRRDVWKSGGIPVVVVPDRRSSSKGGKEPSLRSTSSQRTKRSLSANSAPTTNRSMSNERTPVFDRPGRRRRAMSESDGSDQRTMDYPPFIPARSSSLSAPTSRNNSRSGSLTAESLVPGNVLSNQGQEVPSSAQVPAASPRRAPSSEAGHDDHLSHKPHHRLEVDHLGDPFFGRRLFTQLTPFSIGSIETNGTAPEVSEAKAVSIHPHQNSSVLMVNHSNKPSEDSDDSQSEQEVEEAAKRPVTAAAAAEHEDPVTPPRPQFSMEDVDSPLRNPRAPPVPPAINFIPATPSGSTPFYEQQKKMGNYFESETEDRPHRSMSLVRRALTARRRHSVSYPPKARRPGFLTRTLSLSRHDSRRSESAIDGDLDPMDEPPPEGHKLHPHWLPSYAQDDEDDDLDEDERVYRYPLIDNRPKRTLSSRMKRTFAILPARGDEELYPVSSREGPEKRIIGRTPSGNLRVMRHRSRPSPEDSERPSTAPEGEMNAKHVWHKHAGPAKDEAALPESGRRRRFSVTGTLSEIHGLPRKLSEKRREKRTQELRSSISRPREVRDGVGEVIAPGNYRASLR